MSFSFDQSATNLSNLPIDTASDFIPSIHTPSHWLSCGHTLPQTAGNELLLAITLAAPSISSSLIFVINPGMSIPTGHPPTHFGFLQAKHLLASAIASSLLYPKHTSSKFVALTAGSCSLTGTFTFLASIICYLHIHNYYDDDYRLLQVLA